MARQAPAIEMDAALKVVSVRFISLSLLCAAATKEYMTEPAKTKAKKKEPVTT